MKKSLKKKISNKEIPVLRDFKYDYNHDPSIGDLVEIYFTNNEKDYKKTFGIVTDVLIDKIKTEDWTDEKCEKLSDIIVESLCFKVLTSNGQEIVYADDVLLMSKINPPIIKRI